MKQFFKKYYNKQARKHFLKAHNMPQGTLSSYYNGYSIPKPKKLVAICRALSEVHNKPLEDLLFEAVTLIYDNQIRTII